MDVREDVASDGSHGTLSADGGHGTPYESPAVTELGTISELTLMPKEGGVDDGNDTKSH